MQSRILNDAYDIDSIESINEGTFGCLLKVKIREEWTMKYKGNSFIAVKMEQLGSSSSQYNTLAKWRESLEISSKVSSLKSIYKVNPFVVTVFGGFYAAMSHTLYEYLTRMTKNCKTFIENVDERISAAEKRFLISYESMKARGQLTEEMETANSDRWSRALYEDRDFNVGLIEMELVEGGTLRDMLQDGEIAKSNLSNLYFQLCWSIYTMQREFELIHYDIKPMNILAKKVKEETVFILQLEKDKAFKLVIPAGGTMLIIVDFGVSELGDKNKRPESDHHMGNAIFSPPTFFLLWRMHQREGLGVVRGPDSDIWMLGHVMCSMSLNGWKMPPNELELSEFTLDHLGEIFSPDTRGGRDLDSYAPAEIMSDFIIQHVKDFDSPDEAMEISPIKKYIFSRKLILTILLATCQFQYFAGNGFLPDPDDVPLKRTNYELGSIAAVIGREKDHVLDLGVKFAKGKENIFLSAVNHIKKCDEQCFEFIKRHMGWLPEQRRTYAMEYYESGDFMRISLLHGYFSHLSHKMEGPRSTNTYGYRGLPPEPTKNTLLLDKSIDPTRSLFVRMNEDGMARVISMETNRSNCTHVIDSESMLHWLVNVKSATDDVCPMCELIKTKIQ